MPSVLREGPFRFFFYSGVVMNRNTCMLRMAIKQRSSGSIR